MRRSQTTILKEYEELVNAFERVCKALGWKVKFEQDVDRMLKVVIDGCVYYIAPQANDTPEFPIYYLSVMVHIHSSHRDEPDSVDDQTLTQGLRQPQQSIVALVDAHWQQRRQWAFEQDWAPADEEQF